MTDRPLNIALFVTCLVDLVRPSVGFATVKLLEDTGARVHVPQQTCCGQPAYNSGAKVEAQALARQMIETFEKFDYVVAPSGSCAGMISHHYPELLRHDPHWARRAGDLARKTFELTAYLHDVAGVKNIAARFDGQVTYHDSCAGLRELNVHAQPRALLAQVEGLELVELESADQCCGFGGTFCVKFADISVDIVSKKIANVKATGATTLLAGDLGCLMNIAGKLQRDGVPVSVRHVAEVLADMTEDAPAIAEGRGNPGAGA